MKYIAIFMILVSSFLGASEYIVTEGGYSRLVFRKGMPKTEIGHDTSLTYRKEFDNIYFKRFEGFFYNDCFISSGKGGCDIRSSSTIYPKFFLNSPYDLSVFPIFHFGTTKSEMKLGLGIDFAKKPFSLHFSTHFPLCLKNMEKSRLKSKRSFSQLGGSLSFWKKYRLNVGANIDHNRGKIDFYSGISRFTLGIIDVGITPTFSRNSVGLTFSVVHHFRMKKRRKTDTILHGPGKYNFLPLRKGYGEAENIKISIEKVTSPIEIPAIPVENSNPQIKKEKSITELPIWIEAIKLWEDGEPIK